MARVVEQWPDQVAVCHGAETLTYGQLWEAAQREALRLREELGVGAGQYYVDRCTQDVAYVVRFVALHLVGAQSDILYTTGSTGTPKAVLLSEEGLVANAEHLIGAHGYHRGLRFVVCGPLDHFGPWSKMLPTLMTGGTLIILEGLKDTGALLDALDTKGRTDSSGQRERSATFLVPSAIRMLMQTCRERLEALADSIEFIETGAAPIATADMYGLRTLLPKTRLYNTYASTETGIVCTYPFHLKQADGRGADEDEVLEAGCVGQALPHARLSFTDEGNICVSGKMLMKGYLVKDNEGRWQLQETEVPYVTTDIGHLDAAGRLILTGRSSDFINVGGLKLSPVEVEDTAEGLTGVAECLCVAEPHRLMGQVPKLLVVMAEGATLDKRALARELLAKLGAPWKVPMHYEQVGEIAKLPNGKKDRKRYRTA